MMQKHAHSNKGLIYLISSPSLPNQQMLTAEGFQRLTRGVFVGAVALCQPLSSVRMYRVSGNYRYERLDAFEREVLLTHAGFGCISVSASMTGAVYPLVRAISGKDAKAFGCRRHRNPDVRYHLAMRQRDGSIIPDPLHPSNATQSRISGADRMEGGR
jgi:hypothetical protein